MILKINLNFKIRKIINLHILLKGKRRALKVEYKKISSA